MYEDTSTGRRRDRRSAAPRPRASIVAIAAILATTMPSLLTGPGAGRAAAALTADNVRCRSALAKATDRLAAAILSEQTRCHGDRLRNVVPAATDCNDAAALPADSQATIEAAASDLDAAASSRCGQSSSPPAGSYWVCPAVCDTVEVDTYTGVAECLACVMRFETTAAARAVLGTPTVPSSHADAQACQRRLGRALTRHVKKRVRTQQRCQKRQDLEKLDAAIDCRTHDSNGRLVKLRAKADAAVDKCDPAALAALDSCGNDPASVKACMQSTVQSHGDRVFRASVHRVPDVAPLASAFASRKWLLYAPTGFNPTLGCPAGFPDEASMRADLALARAAGFDAVVTSGADCGLASIARLAREEGFATVVMGLFMFNETIRLEEVADAIAAAEYVDAYGVGNEGLIGCGGSLYTEQTLLETMLELRDATGKPTASSEQIEDYLGGGCLGGLLLDRTDWLFPISHPFNNGIRSPAAGVVFTSDRDAQLATLSAKSVLHKESGWPSGGAPGATEANQEAYFIALQETPVDFVFFEAFDQPWKTTQPWEPVWGLWRSDRSPKQIVSPPAVSQSP